MKKSSFEEYLVSFGKKLFISRSLSEVANDWLLVNEGKKRERGRLAETMWTEGNRVSSVTPPRRCIAN